MNKIILIMLIFIVNSCNTPQETNILELIVYKVNVDIDTAIQVDCHDFQSTFNKKITTYSIKDKIILKRIDLLLKKNKRSNENISIDVRKKIIIQYKNKTSDILCIDRFNIMLNGNLMQKDNNLLELTHNL